MKSIVLSAICTASLALFGCSESTPEGPGPLRAVNEARPTGPSVTLETRVEGDRILVDVVAHDVPELSGAAFRIAHPAWAKLESREVGKGWAPEALHLVKNANETEIALADTIVGKKVGHPGGASQKLATLTLLASGAPPQADLGAITVVGARSELRDKEGGVVKFGVAGAKLTR